MSYIKFNIKDIYSYNEKGEAHGLWTIYHANGELWYKGNFINGKEDGYWEEYYYSESVIKKYYIS